MSTQSSPELCISGNPTRGVPCAHGSFCMLQGRFSAGGVFIFSSVICNFKGRSFTCRTRRNQHVFFNLWPLPPPTRDGDLECFAYMGLWVPFRGLLFWAVGRKPSKVSRGLLYYSWHMYTCAHRKTGRGAVCLCVSGPSFSRSPKTGAHCLLTKFKFTKKR